MKRDLICIICPKGCSLQAEISGDTVTTTGNGCPRGAQYAENQFVVTSALTISVRFTRTASVE